MSDFDSPWKDALELFFPAFLAFFFPRVQDAVDLSRGYEALDKELQQIVREAAVGRRYADKLFKVWLRDGREVWILIHIEVQSQRDDEFTERMFIYHYRLYDRYRRPVVSLAVLADEQPAWRPDRFGYSLCGCTIGLEFPIVKLLDFGENSAVLEENSNPFAPLVLAHLRTQATRLDAPARREWKIRLLKGLYERGLTGEQIRQLFRLIDWMMDLPVEFQEQVDQVTSQVEEEKAMAHIDSPERIAWRDEIHAILWAEAERKAAAKAEGKAEGKAETLLQVLQQRFEAKVPADLDALIRSTTDLALLERWVHLALQAGSLEQFRELSQA